MSTRSALTVALVIVALTGCGSPPSGPTPSGLDQGRPTIRSEQKRAVARKDTSTVGPITAEVVSWRVGKLTREGAGEYGDDRLLVEMRFSTSDPTVSKRTDAIVPGQLPRLADEFGNKFVGMSAAVGTAGVSKNRSVRAGEPVTDLLVFEPPLSTAKSLTLDYPAKCVEVESEEQFRFTIPLK